MGLGLMERDGQTHVVPDGPEVRLGRAMGLLNVATAEVVAAIAEALRSDDWQGDGIVTPEQWVALRCGVTASRARRLVAAAVALESLPAAAGAFTQGVLSEDQVGLVCRHVDAAHDAEVTELARHCTINQLRRILPSVVPPTPEPDPEPEPAEEGDADSAGGDTPARREVAFGNDEFGRWWARMLLPPDEGALVQRAIEASLASLRNDEPADADPERGYGPLAPRLGWADAVVHMAERALTNIEGTGRTPADRYQVIIHVEGDDVDRARCTWGRLSPGRSPATSRAMPADGWSSSARARQSTSSGACAPSTTACASSSSGATAVVWRRGAGARAACTCTTSPTTRTVASPCPRTSAASALPITGCITPASWASPAIPPCLGASGSPTSRGG